MELVKFVSVIGVAVAVGFAVYEARCRLGFHPIEGRRMLTGVRDKHQSVAQWECGRCSVRLGETNIDVDNTLMLNLRKQVGPARARSKVIRMTVVPTERESA